MAAVDAPRLLLVAGVARSGSTALDFMLGNRDDAFSLGEVFSWYRPFRPYQLHPTCECGLPVTECPVWRRIGRPPARHLHRRVADTLAVDTVVDSSKRLSWIADAHRWASRDGMAPHVILTWRRPQQLAYSYWKRGALDWASNLDRYLHQLATLGLPYHVVSFDALIEDPPATLARLLDAVGLELVPGQERFWEGELHSLFGSGGTREQVRTGDSRLSTPDLPDDFSAYWDALPKDLIDHLDELDERVRAGAPPIAPRTGSWVPPPWYLRQRAAAVRQAATTRLAARRQTSTPT